ncbi:uncharacterized protein RCC_07099 [Ramularia collo-cygni]|uniref:Uncharacterized protein n=1 Tax=Ramularia collo-cygni TaxID=112498 RepID=A0A2D3VC07_9PEZI|nr:uncharacterized protein RCC_07099 [Ramularia collo-cygni]CZT21236.1 uncharacterized protein RCC_07099 [Ramularia collo-cygni]
MPPSKSHADPFTTTSNGPPLRKTNASAASTRTRQQLFAPTLSRRPTSRTTPRIDDDVLPDSNSEQENSTRQRRHARRLRGGSPVEGRGGRARSKQQVEELEIVNRQPDGTYLLDGMSMGLLAAPTPVFGQDMADSADAMDAAIARRYFACGAHMSSNRRSTKHDEDLHAEFERERPEIQLRLREKALARLQDAKWMYEPVDRFQSSGVP